MSPDTGLPVKTTNDPVRVLYVDDDRDFLEVVKIILESNGNLHIDTCLNGHEALDRLRNGNYGVILSDNRMVMMSGTELLVMVRRMYPDLPFILFSGRIPEEVLTGALANGLTAYLVKEGDPDALFHELEMMILSAVNPGGSCAE